jgi:hypothetical protein
MGLRAAWRGVASGYAMRGGGMNGSTAWADTPQNDAPLFVPSRLELAANCQTWAYNLAKLSKELRQEAECVGMDVQEECYSKEDKLDFYDGFVRNLLRDYTDSEIYRAQWKWIQDQTERMKREETA